MIPECVSDIILYLTEKVNNLQGGGLKHCIHHWQKLTSDFEVLATVSGLPIQFSEMPPPSPISHNCCFTKEEDSFISKEISTLLKKNVIAPCGHEDGEFISPIFLTKKSDGSNRLILNLKKLNEHIPYIHFKMDSIQTVLSLVTEGCFMAKIDIKDAYYSIPISEPYQKYLKFLYKGKLYKFLCLPNGLCLGPRKFTKLLKPALARLRKDHVTLSAYIDDIITLNSSQRKCYDNVLKCLEVFNLLGFVVHPIKSQFVPSNEIEYLGFIINSVEMTVRLTDDKKEKIKCLCKSVLKSEKLTIRTVAQLLGNFTSSFPAVKFGALHYRFLECDKISALKYCKGDFDKCMSLSDRAIEDITWWHDNVQYSCNTILKGNPSYTVTSDACKTGWGATLGSVRTGGLFSFEESNYHINILELKAVLFSLKALCSDMQTVHIKVLSDNSTTVHTINNMGSCKSMQCNLVVHEIWDWAIQRDIWLTVSHIPGVDNISADEESRKCDTRKEWKLNEDIFSHIISHFDSTPDIDLFASRINTQLPMFCSYYPDPDAAIINAFSFSWGDTMFYCFPPFSCIGRCLQKIIHDRANGIMVVPNWPNQPWFTLLHDVLIGEPLIISSSSNLLYLPSHPQIQHPLKNLELLACRLSGRVFISKNIQKT